jgi:hypothetical protein
VTLFRTDPVVPAAPGVPTATESPWTLEQLGPPAFAFIARGNPAPQGSKKPKGLYRSKAGNLVSRMVESAEGLDQWRGDIVQAATNALPPGWIRLAENNRDGLVLDVVFSMEAPSALPKRTRSWCGTQPDLDKLARAVGDALGTAGVYKDDARIIAYRRLEKLYVSCADPDALPHPGAVIRVWSLRGSTYDINPGRAR